MANIITPQDVYQLMNQIALQALGNQEQAVVDTTSFVSVGEKLLRTGTENTLNAISTVIARTIFSVRPYRAKLSSLLRSEERWGAQTRKIVYLYSGAEKSENWNTQLAPDQLADGNSIDMYKINSPKAVQLNFYGTKTLQKHITRFRNQLFQAFHSEAEFIAFIDGAMVEFWNEVEIMNESRARLTMLNFMGGMLAYNSNANVIDVVAGYNAENDTEYTREQLLSGVNIEGFMKYLSSLVKIYSERLTDFGFKYHANLTGTNIPRHTPKGRQRMIMYNPVFIKAKAEVYSSLFNPSYLDIGDFEGVNFWQNADNPTAIQVKPNYLNLSNGSSQDATSTISHPYVLGLLYDEEALGVTPQYDYSSATPFNSAGEYWNLFLHWNFNAYNDFTENAVLFVLGDGGPAADD